MTVIDFHTHTFPDAIAEKAIRSLSQKSHSRAFLNGTAEALKKSMKEAGIHRSVVLPVATNPEKLARLNDVSIRENGKEGLVYFGAAHPLAPDALWEMERLKEHGIRGIKIHPVYQGVALDDVRFLRLLEKAGELDLIVVTHAGDDIGFPGLDLSSPGHVKRALSQVGPVKMVLAHMGGWKRWDEAKDSLSERNVWLDTSFSLGTISDPDGYYTPEERRLLSREAFCDMVRTFGSDRILFGTDSPWTDQKESVRDLLTLPLSDQEKENILSGNGKKLLGI